MSDPGEMSESSSDASYKSYSSSDNEGGHLALALDPSQLSEGSGLPQNGHDYLRLVQEEREKYPLVALASQPPPPPRPTAQLGNKKMKLNPSAPPSNDEVEQDELKYSDEILNNFKELKQKIEGIRDSILVQEVGTATCDDGQLSEKQFKRQSSRAVKRASNLMKLMEIGHRPEVSTLINHSQFELHTTLEKMADEYEMTPHHSTIIHTDWLYSIMAALREPLEPDIYSTLRRLARLCIAKRKLYESNIKKRAAQRIGHNEFEGPKEKAPKVIADKRGSSGSAGGSGGENNEELVRQLEEEEYTSSLLIICIVRHYYGQVDLK